jgi:hypothetical protein
VKRLALFSLACAAVGFAVAALAALLLSQALGDGQWRGVAAQVDARAAERLRQGAAHDSFDGLAPALTVPGLRRALNGPKPA